MAKAKTIYVCQQCGSQQARWSGRCPDCQEWNSLVEERVVPEPVRSQPTFAAGEATPITEVESVDAPRVLFGGDDIEWHIGQQIDLVEDQQFRLKKDRGIFERLVLSFRDTENDHFCGLPQIVARRTDEVPDVFDQQ